MQSRKLVCLVAAATLGASSLSFAQPHDRGGPGHGPRHEQRHDPRHNARPGPGPRADHYHYGARGPEWRRGGHVPPQYRSRHYVVDNWRAHRLSPPPRGYHWVQVGNDYVLAAIATGLIAQLVLSNS